MFDRFKIFTICLIVACTTAHGQDDSKLISYVDSLMQPAQRPGMPASYLLVAQNGKTIIRKAYGLANIELETSSKPEHCFTIASISKQMVAVSILQLASQGRLKLDDDIRKYFPDFDTRANVITIEHLLTHTSGIYNETGATGASGKTLFDLSVALGVLSEKEFLEYVRQHDLYFKAGTDWGWNGYGYFMCFFIIEKVSGMPFNEYIRKNLFEPAGMTRSFSKVDGNRLGLFGIKDLVSTYYQPDADGKWIWKDLRRLTPLHFYERYAIVTNMDDLLKWHTALRTNKLLPKEWTEKAWTAFKLKDGRTTNYGYGWVISIHNGVRVLSHIGIGTNPICVVQIPEKDICIIYTQFHGTFEQTELIAKKILSRMLDVSYPKVQATKTSMNDYVGAYQIHRIGLRTTAQLSDVPVYTFVTERADTLFIQQTATEKNWLRPAGKDRFLPSRSDNMYYIFNRDKNGKVNSLTTEGTIWTFGPAVENKKVDIKSPPLIVRKDIDNDLLKKYSGAYYMTALDIYRFIETDGITLFNKFQGRRQELIPIANNKFVVKGVEDTTFEFNPNGAGVLVLTVKALRSQEFRKVE
jgi:CubicO group peptidase (beta-lactamase class C family)